MDLVRRPILCALGWSIALLAGALPALAQESAAVAPPAGAPAAVAKAEATPSPRVARRRTLVDLTISPFKSFGVGGDQLAPPGTLTDNQIFFNGQLDIYVLPRLRLYERRDNHVDLGGRQFKKGKPSYGGLSDDLEYDTGIAYLVNRQLEVSEEFMYRYRVCCPGSGDPQNPTPRIEQGLRTEVSYLAGPLTRIGRPLRLRVSGNYVNHHLDLGLGLPAGTPVLGKTWVSKVAATLSVPVYGQTRVVPYFTVEHYSDFYDNNLTPSMTNRTFYGFRIRGTSFASYRAFVKSEHQTNPGGDVSHKVELYLESSFRLHY
jgi:hypothetical protein